MSAEARTVGEILDALPRAKAEPRPDAPRDLGNPRPGFWFIRPVSRGPFVPACIRLINTQQEPGNPENEMDRSPSLGAFINGNPVALADVWERRGAEITEEQHDLAVMDATAGLYPSGTWKSVLKEESNG